MVTILGLLCLHIAFSLPSRAGPDSPDYREYVYALLGLGSLLECVVLVRGAADVIIRKRRFDKKMKAAMWLAAFGLFGVWGFIGFILVVWSLHGC